MAKIQYENKVALIENADIPDINKVKANDMNEIKQVVNENDDKFLTNGLNVSNELDEDYRVNLLKTKNLCDEIFELGNINDSGVESASTNTFRSVNYYNVKGGSTLICSYTATTGTKLNWVACYDENKTFITRLTDIQQTAFTLADNVAYIRIGFYKTSNIARNDFSDVMLVYGDTPETYEPFIPNQILVDNEKYTDTLNVGNVVDSRSRVNILYSKNLFDKNAVSSLDAYISGVGTITNDNANKTIYIPIKANTTYTISKVASQRFRVATYTSTPANGSTSSNVQTDNTGTKLTITSGANDNYLAVWLYNSGVDTLTYQQIIDSLTIQEESSIITPSIYVDGEEIYSKIKITNYTYSGTTNELSNLTTNVSATNKIPVFADIGTTGEYSLFIKNNYIGIKVVNNPNTNVTATIYCIEIG